MGRFINAVSRCAAQAWFITFRQNKELSYGETLLITDIKQHVPSLFIVATEASKTAAPGELGHFLSLIRHTLVELTMFLMQSPTTQQTIEYCIKLHDFIASRCPTINVTNLRLIELAIALRACMAILRERNEWRAIIEASLLPLNNEESRYRAYLLNLSLINPFFKALMAMLRPTLRERFGLFGWARLSRGFANETKDGTMPDPEILGIQTVLNNPHPEDEMRPTGERITLERFCKLAHTVPVDSCCSICAEAVEQTGEDDLAAVVTACGHHFHKGCLDHWVNESGMRTANLCPTCRAEMCKGRPRVLASMLAQLGGVDLGDGDDDSVYDEDEDRWRHDSEQ